MFYVVNMRGLRPTCYTMEDRSKAYKVYNYLKIYVTNEVSINRVKWQKIIKDSICRSIY